ncbi:MAG: hypothetical protein QOI13_1849 [Paraburkholderia sp.]|nr:hypothetical protein [Paraburkholderia sp.]
MYLPTVRLLSNYAHGIVALVTGRKVGCDLFYQFANCLPIKQMLIGEIAKSVVSPNSLRRTVSLETRDGQDLRAAMKLLDKDMLLDTVVGKGPEERSERRGRTLDLLGTVRMTLTTPLFATDNPCATNAFRQSAV